MVDDGSSDDTRAVVQRYVSEQRLALRYLWKPNGGKHTALNLAVREARGSRFTVVDSDDWLAPRALERMSHHWDQLGAEQRARFKGVCGLFAYPSGEVVGDRFPQDVLDSDDLALDLEYQVEGDKLGFTRIEVMREFPFPEDLSGQVRNSVVYVTESLVWHRMGAKYQTRFVNEVFGIKEYQPGGITDRGRLLQARNARATLAFVQEVLTCGRRLPARLAIKYYSNFIRYSLHARAPLVAQRRLAPSNSLFLGCLPLGYLLYQRDRLLLRRDERPRTAA